MVKEDKKKKKQDDYTRFKYYKDLDIFPSYSSPFSLPPLPSFLPFSRHLLIATGNTGDIVVLPVQVWARVLPSQLLHVSLHQADHVVLWEEMYVSGNEGMGVKGGIRNGEGGDKDILRKWEIKSKESGNGKWRNRELEM